MILGIGTGLIINSRVQKLYKKYGLNHTSGNNAIKTA